MATVALLPRRPRPVDAREVELRHLRQERLRRDEAHRRPDVAQLAARHNPAFGASLLPRGEPCTRGPDILDVQMRVDRDGARMAGIEATLEELRSQTGSSRVTLRQNLPGEYAFPVTYESLAPGAGSLREERTIDLRSQPVAQEVGGGRQVIQDDCASASVDPAFHRMREVYGGLAAQIVTPVVLDGCVIAIVSVHQLGLQRHWSQSEIEACAETAERLVELL
jgi:hypothetical protein